MTDAQLACLFLFAPLMLGCLLAAVVEGFNIHRKERALRLAMGATR